ncbi:uncharacterized protein LOC116929213 [Daphnia magna]|uniref:Uncharacterized protein n=2 Tax=Daphnia magna TaxID=35525 RepID=A0A164T2F4_9CRUS|nr:uncharacterized protein LOC116929213 [Daphnia magna]KAK4037254.1 hypothetical protein OUZ56_029291 [Daphnia magna]KZS10153.1 Uncharacterized protein APZ42_025427 [Daphnia magna]
MNTIQRIATISRMTSARQMSSAKLTPELAKIKAKQEFFQRADGNLVHEKTGTDRALFYLTSALVTVSMGMSLQFYYEFSFPKKG